MEEDRPLASTAAWLHGIRTASYASARQLLPPDQDVNVRGADGQTALHVVASLRHKLADVEALLLNGADPDVTDDQGRTPLRLAQELNQTNVARYLIIHDELLRALTVYLGRKPLLPDIVTMMRDTHIEYALALS